MQTSPRPMDPWIPLLGISLLLIAGVGAHPKIIEADHIPAVHIALLVGTVIAGITAVLSKKLRPHLVHRLALSALGVYGVYLALDALRYGYSANALLLVGRTGHILLLAGTPLLWGFALSRREDPTQERTQRYGRMAAGLVQVSFVFLFVSEVQLFSYYFSSGLGSGASLAALERVVETGARVLLLWASVLCMRTAADPLKIQEWAARIHRLTFASFGAGILAQALNMAVYSRRDDDGGQFPLSPLAWRVGLAAALTLLASFTLPPSFRSSPPSYNSEPVSHP